MENAETIISVSELNRQVKSLLNANFATVWLRGEISELKIYDSSGHAYFTLKDASSSIPAAFFRGARLCRQMQLSEGMEVEARGRVDIYELNGKYQFVAAEIRPVGAGALQLRFEELLRRLRDEGLFDPVRKRPLPALPKCIGLITSIKSAAIRDFLKILLRRHPNIHVRIINTLVQGPGAAHVMSGALAYFNRHHSCDVIVLTRGGGSLEDLWEFNEEELVRAVAQSEIPVISAVGHERDTSLCDYAADLIAKTPSEAAELVVQAETDLRTRLENAWRRLEATLRFQLTDYQHRLRRTAACPFLRNPMDAIDQRAQRLDDLGARLLKTLPQMQLGATQVLQNLSARLNLAVKNHFTRQQERLVQQSRTLNALNPRLVLSRGYAILQKANGQAVRHAQEVAQEEYLRTILSDSEFQVQVVSKAGE